MGTTTFLPHLSAAAELLVINLVAQRDPESDSEFASCGNPGFPQSSLDQFAPVEALQLRIMPYGVDRRLTPEISQQRVALLAQRTQPLLAPAESARRSSRPIHCRCRT